MIEAQNEKKVGLEARANDAESRIKDLNLKLENVFDIFSFGVSICYFLCFSGMFLCSF